MGSTADCPTATAVRLKGLRRGLQLVRTRTAFMKARRRCPQTETQCRRQRAARADLLEILVVDGDLRATELEVRGHP